MPIEPGSTGEHVALTDAHDERRIVTVVAADVVGSTRLVEQLDGEHAKLLIGEALKIAISAIERFGGTVKDLAGDGVLALFGAPVTHEDDATRALLASLAITDRIREYGEEVRRGYGIEGFGMRVGVATGEAVLGAVGGGGRVEYGAVGDAVNTAARLQSAALPGTVLVAASTRGAAEQLFGWGASSRLELKGKELPVTATTLEAIVETVAPVAVATPLLGRTAELDTIDGVLDALATGRGAVLFVVADAGLGKSRLLGEARSGAAERPGVRWFDAHCASYAEAIPYWVYRDLLFDWLGISQSDPPLRMRIELQRHLMDAVGPQADEFAPYLASLCGMQLEPEMQAKLQSLSPEALKYRTFEVLTALFNSIAVQQPLVIALDDFHWADPTSVLLSAQLLPLVERLPIVVLIAMRPERDHPSWSLRRTCEEEFPHLFTELRLNPLAQDDERRLVQALSGDVALEAVDVERLLGYSEGNPFFLEEMIRSIGSESGAVVPITIGSAIQARVDRLDATSRQLLRAAAVLGRSFSLDVLAGMTHEPSETVWRVIHQLQRIDLVREQRRYPEPEFRFKHALIQEAIYASLVQTDRLALHRSAAEALESTPAGEQPALLGVLAIHWRNADDPAKAIHYLRLAGDTARNEWALDEAIGHYRALVPLLHRVGQSDEAAVTLFKLGLTLHTAMRYEEANAVWQEAFTTWQPELPVTAPAAELRIASPLVPGPPDILGSTAWSNIHIAMQVYDRVVEAWPGRNTVPSLAERWSVTSSTRSGARSTPTTRRQALPFTSRSAVHASITSVRITTGLRLACGRSTTAD
jgi:class 3 adenylate cyclase/tetratricopeptide (TPR) repeat protein